jgi:hypothetical protein
MSLSLPSPTGSVRHPLQTWRFTWKSIKKLKRLMAQSHLVTWIRTANRWIVVLFPTWTRNASPKLPDRLWSRRSACSVGTGGRIPYCEGLGSLIWPFNPVKRQRFTCVELPFQSPMSCHTSYSHTVTLLYAWVKQNLCYGFHKCSTSELTLSTLNPSQTLTLAPVQILYIPLSRRVEFDPKPVMWDL